MKSQVTLLLVCMLFSEAISLACHQCLPTIGGCLSEAATCPDQCLTATTSVYINGAKFSDISMKTCGTADLCATGSINLGSMKVINNAKCCKTDFCNSETLSAVSKQAPTGRMCYTCGNNSCSERMTCEGNEDRCITASVQQGGSTVSMKGCASKGFCVSTGSSSVQGFGMSKVECCKGNLCNGAESFTLLMLESLLLMMVPLLSSFLVY
ncbi:Urokinase plasminogen activator surface receptor [Bagarius yarrelli]|uniref:Urokinase plasminogen activator surface receptor n=1 Tax=Bagarius yarrelli TaxID=175774 RepID=A0A556U029_BAGYA|nr:Urokinase plasminogen activator surface receptor [Bagarius yarrelli]